MQCEQARSLLFDYAEDRLPEAERASIGEHLDRCDDCVADYRSIVDLQRQALAWQEVAAPGWQPPRMPRTIELNGFQRWFPSLTSAAALTLVLVLFFQSPPAVPRGGITAPETAAAVRSGPSLPAAPRTADHALASSRFERQQELQALVQLLRAEMDRRSEETEESLRYVIAHQLQGQREIDDLYEYIRKVAASAPGPGDQM